MKVDKENILKGEVARQLRESTGSQVVSIAGLDVATFGNLSTGYDKDKAHAQLFADALEALNRTGLTPSELADSRDVAIQNAFIRGLETKESDIFVLPEKWALKCETEEQAAEFLPWVEANKQSSILYDVHMILDRLFHYPAKEYAHCRESLNWEGYTEITFEQFKQHVLKQEPEVKEQPAELSDVTGFSIIDYSVPGQYFISPLNNVVVNDGKHTATHFAGTVVKTAGSTHVGAYSDSYPKHMWQPYKGEPIIHTQEQRFEAVVAARLEAIRELILVKGREYRRNGDVFHNFNAGGKMLGCTPERALLGFAAKHFVSVVDLVNDLDSGKVPAEAVVNEKLGDAMVYLVLLEGLFKERLNTI